MTSTKKVRKAMKRIDEYCKENNLEGHHYQRTVVWQSLNLYAELQDKHTANFIKDRLMGHLNPAVRY